MSLVPLRRPRLEALLIAGLLLLLVLGDLATMFADRAEPVNRGDFAGEFYGSEGESVPFADPWPELDGWFLEWFAAIEITLLVALVAAAANLVVRRQIPRFAPWAAGGFLTLTAVNVAIPFGSVIEWHRFAALYASLGIAVSVAAIIGVAMLRARHPAPTASP